MAAALFAQGVQAQDEKVAPDKLPPKVAEVVKARFPGAPDLPTIAEQGLPEYQATLWQGFFAPSSIDGAVAERIARDVRTVLAQAPTREKLDSIGAALFEDTPSNFRAFFAAEIEKWRSVVKKTNLKLE